MMNKPKKDTRHSIAMRNDDLFNLLSKQAKHRGVTVEKVIEQYVEESTKDEYARFEKMYKAMRREYILINGAEHETEQDTNMLDTWWTYMVNMSRGFFDTRAVTNLLCDNIQIVKSDKNKGATNDKQE